MLRSVDPYPPPYPYPYPYPYAPTPTPTPTPTKVLRSVTIACEGGLKVSYAWP